MLPDTDDPERFVAGSTFETGTGRALVVVSAKPFRDKGLLILFEGFARRDAAETLRGQLLTVDSATRRQLADDEFWPADLVGLAAVTPQGATLGIVDRLEFGPGQDRLVVVTPDEREVLVPFVSDIVADPADGQIVVDAPEGLFGD